MKRFLRRSIQNRVRHSVVYLILFTALLATAVAVYRGGVHLAQLQPEEVTLKELPSALALSFLRMSASYLACIIFAFCLGLTAARTVLGEKFILPLLDILQSVPVVGFFPAAFSFFIGLSHGHRIGVEMAAVFLIFTSQAWNMAFAVYEATKTIPQDNLDAVTSFGVKGSQRFWKLYAPAAIPRLVYNSILSWSNGWYFLVACEIIAVGPVKYHLPGIGSFLALAAEQDQGYLIAWGLASLALLILGLDFVLWRPATQWAERFRQDYTMTSSDTTQKHFSLFMPRIFFPKVFFQRRPIRIFKVASLNILKIIFSPIVGIFQILVLPLCWDLPLYLFTNIYNMIHLQIAKPTLVRWGRLAKKSKLFQYLILWLLGVGFGLIAGSYLIRSIQPPWPPLLREIPGALIKSTGRLLVSLLVSFMIAIPITLWSWNKPKLRQAITTFSQIGASLPAAALFPLFILILVNRLGGGMELSSILLLITGMVWYLIFNCVGGAATIPIELLDATRALGLSKVQTWKKLVLPAIAPALVTGTITAWGGGWNALVLSEYVTYKGKVFTVEGIGALLSTSVYQLGDNQAITLCIAGLVAWVILINTLIWKPLYRTTAERYKLDYQ